MRKTSRRAKKKIVSCLIKAVKTAGFAVEKTWGETIEDRGSQITYSSLGQQAPLEDKVKWDAVFAKRKKIKTILDTLIPEFRFVSAARHPSTLPSLALTRHTASRAARRSRDFGARDDLCWGRLVPRRE